MASKRTVNHNVEFRTLEGGKTGYSILMSAVASGGKLTGVWEDPGTSPDLNQRNGLRQEVLGFIMDLNKTSNPFEEVRPWHAV